MPAIIIIILIVFGIGGTNELSRVSCKAQWEHSGMSYSYGFFKGCTIQRADGTWIPDTAYREVTK